MNRLFTAVMTILIFFSQMVYASPSVDDFGQLPSTSKMALSPDGKMIAFRKFEEAKDTLIVYSLEKNKILQAIDISTTQPNNIYFISPQKLIIVVENRMRLDGYIGQHDISAAFSLDIESGSLKQLLRPGQSIYFGQTAVGRVIGLSSNKKFAFMPALIDPKRDPLAISRKKAPPLNYTIMKVDIGSPVIPRQVSRGSRDAIDFYMGPNNDILIEERYNQVSNRHEILVKKGSKLISIYEDIAPLRKLNVVGLTADYKSLVVLKYTGEKNRLSYLTMSLKDGKLSDPGISREDADVDAVLQDINRIAYGVQYSGLVPKYKMFDPSIDKFINSIVNAFPERSVVPVSWSDDWKKVIVYVAGSSYPGEYYLFDSKLKARFIGGSRTNITPDDVHPIATSKVSARDGLQFPVLLTIPKSKVSSMKNLPAVVLPHGGPESYDQIDFDWLAQAFANEGYLVIQPQFRGSSGFGWDFIAAGHGEWGGKMIDDITDSLDFAIKKGMVDKNKVCIVGASYGGYAALASGAFTPNKYQCIVSINGISNLIDFMNDRKGDYGRHHSVLDYFERFMTNGEGDKDALKAISPYYHATNFTAPVLLIHGANDDNVKIEQSQMMTSSLKNAKKEVTFIELDNESHYLQKNETRKQMLKSAVDFVNKNLH